MLGLLLSALLLPPLLLLTAALPAHSPACLPAFCPECVLRNIVLLLLASMSLFRTPNPPSLLQAAQAEEGIRAAEERAKALEEQKHAMFLKLKKVRAGRLAFPTQHAMLVVPQPSPAPCNPHCGWALLSRMFAALPQTASCGCHTAAGSG